MDGKSSFFDFAAEVGLTKHIGGTDATDRLVSLCHIEQGKTILDVGCGVGATPCLLAKKYGCRVTGVDIREVMIARSNERAKKEGVLDLVEFKVADAQDLPFGDNQFDAVITESVTAFPEDKQKAVHEYVRVTKPGGYIGLNEGTWLKSPPPPEMVAWASQEVGASVKPLTLAEWKGLLKAAGLQDIFAEVHGVDVQQESVGILQRYGLGGMLAVMVRMLRLYMKNPEYRSFVKEVGQGGITPPNLNEYFGYGLFVGRK